MDQLRIALGEVDVLAAITRVVYDEAEWDGPDPLVVERVASLLGLIEKSAADAMAAFHRLHGAVADATPAPSGTGEAFDYSEGTAPGGARPLPKQDAEIVRRLRTLSQDGRFDGYTDDALIHLFRRNQQAVGGTEEQIMDVMTGPADPSTPADEQTESGETMSAEDAAIVRRIRAQCPDRRFDGGSDAELLDLFRRNKRVLSRSDEDVIAVMTRPR
jgi:hypothetical protein